MPDTRLSRPTSTAPTTNPNTAATDPLQSGDLKDPLAPDWVLPLAPAGYGGPGVINPYSNVDPLNPMAAELEGKALEKSSGDPTPMSPVERRKPVL